MKITRSVIIDLWPMYVEGTASADTRALIDGFLREDPEWAKTLQRAGPDTPLPAPDIKPDQESLMLNKIKKRLRLMRWMLLLAMLFSAQAFGRIVADTSWDVSPRNFIITSAIAGLFWIGFIVAILRVRRYGP